MTDKYDAFLEAQYAEEAAQGGVPTVPRLMSALMNHEMMGLKQAKDIVEDFLRRHAAASHPKQN
jgi:hypothetical protein